MTIKEMIENFDVNQLNKSPCFFDLKKLNWMANQYFKKLPPQTY